MRTTLVALFLVCTTAAVSWGADPAAEIAEAQRLAKVKRYAEAAAAFEAYIKAHPKANDAFTAYLGAFKAHERAGNADHAQKAGKQIFKRYPDAKGTFAVLATWTEHDWKIPKLKTSYKVLDYWTFTRIDGSRYPDRRLAFLEIIAKQHKRSPLVKSKGILYTQAWCHLQAARHDRAIELGEKYLRAKPRGDYLQKTRLVVARAMLASSPARTEEATKLLRRVISEAGTRQRNDAKDLLATAGAAPPSIQLTKGFPTAEGLGRMVVLTNLPKSSAHRKAVQPWVDARKATVVSFKGIDVLSAAGRLRKHGAEYVAVLVKPSDLDNDFQLAMLELCRGLDKDPMPDFYYGFLVARDAADLAAFTARILDKEKAGGTSAGTVAPQNLVGSASRYDYLLHYGHGTARGIDKGPAAKHVAGLSLPNHPVIFSGACFNGVCARTHERFILGNHHGKPDEIATDDVIALAWIHAGATGLFAALDGDRGEMAGAEWEHFKEHAPSLGAVMGYQYRLIFTSLRESFTSFPRYTQGRAKDKSFYGVMLRGQASRILLSDPMYRPLHAPLAKPTTKTTVAQDMTAGTLTITVEVLRHSNGPFVNTLPTRSGTPFKETRLYARVELPRGFTGTLGFPQVNAGKIKASKVQAKHEIWGGRRYINLQVESENWKLTTKGSTTTLVFPLAR